jgi:hypothetical protein
VLAGLFGPFVVVGVSTPGVRDVGCCFRVHRPAGHP